MRTTLARGAARLKLSLSVPRAAMQSFRCAHGVATPLRFAALPSMGMKCRHFFVASNHRTLFHIPKSLPVSRYRGVYKQNQKKLQVSLSTAAEKELKRFDEIARGKILSFFAAAIFFALSYGWISFGWSQMKIAQMSTWTRRVYDTFVFLDTVEKYTIEPTKSDVEAIFCAMARSGEVDKMVSIEELRMNPFVKRCMTDHETDLAEIFEEENAGSAVPWNDVYLSLGVLYLLSRDHLQTKDEIHGQMYLLIEQLAVARGESEGTIGNDVEHRYISAADVKSWLKALAYLGVIRAQNFLVVGTSLRPSEMQDKAFDELFEQEEKADNITASTFLDDAVTSYVDYEMFVGRNTFITAGAAIRELSRREEYLYGEYENGDEENADERMDDVNLPAVTEN